MCVCGHWILGALKVIQDKDEEGRSWKAEVSLITILAVQHRGYKYTDPETHSPGVKPQSLAMWTGQVLFNLNMCLRL